VRGAKRWSAVAIAARDVDNPLGGNLFMPKPIAISRMPRTRTVILALVIAGCAGYVLVSGGSLPELVASHFDADGQVRP